jgi:hypothetical protein
MAGGLVNCAPISGDFLLGELQKIAQSMSWLSPLNFCLLPSICQSSLEANVV